jgi:hypothetical protein
VDLIGQEGVKKLLWAERKEGIGGINGGAEKEDGIGGMSGEDDK